MKVIAKNKAPNSLHLTPINFKAGSFFVWSGDLYIVLYWFGGECSVFNLKTEKVEPLTESLYPNYLKVEDIEITYTI